MWSWSYLILSSWLDLINCLNSGEIRQAFVNIFKNLLFCVCPCCLTQTDKVIKFPQIWSWKIRLPFRGRLHLHTSFLLFFEGWRWEHVFVYFSLVRFVIIHYTFVPMLFHLCPLTLSPMWMFLECFNLVYFRKWSGNNSRVNFVILHDRVLSWKNKITVKRHQYDSPTRSGRC